MSNRFERTECSRRRAALKQRLKSHIARRDMVASQAELAEKSLASARERCAALEATMAEIQADLDAVPVVTIVQLLQDHLEQGRDEEAERTADDAARELRCAYRPRTIH